MGYCMYKILYNKLAFEFNFVGKLGDNVKFKLFLRNWDVARVNFRITKEKETRRNIILCCFIF